MGSGARGNLGSVRLPELRDKPPLVSCPHAFCCLRGCLGRGCVLWVLLQLLLVTTNK